MRKNNNKGIVRTFTTGYIEGDMLGQVYLWISERKNRRYPQRPHRTYKRRPSPESKVRVWFRATVEWFQTAPSACWRSIKFSNKYGRRLATQWTQSKDRVPKYLSGVRKDKRNGN